MERLAVWRGLDEWRAEAALVRIEGDRLTAEGTQLGAAPYRLELEVSRSEQRYTPLGGDRVNFASGDFSADIQFDENGLVSLYEDYLERVS